MHFSLKDERTKNTNVGISNNKIVFLFNFYHFNGFTKNNKNNVDSTQIHYLSVAKHKKYKIT